MFKGGKSMEKEMIDEALNLQPREGGT